MKREVSPEILNERNEKIVELIEKGFPASGIAKQLRLTRERVSQIYFRMAGKSIKEFQTIEGLKKIEPLLSREYPKKLCLWCSNEFLPNKNTVFCSPICYMKHRAEVHRRLVKKYFKEERQQLDKELRERAEPIDKEELPSEFLSEGQD